MSSGQDCPRAVRACDHDPSVRIQPAGAAIELAAGRLDLDCDRRHEDRFQADVLERVRQLACLFSRAGDNHPWPGRTADAACQLRPALEARFELPSELAPQGDRVGGRSSTTGHRGG